MTAYRHRSRWQCWKELHALTTHHEPREDQRHQDPPREPSPIIIAS